MTRANKILDCCENLLERINNGIRNNYGSIIAFLVFFLLNSWAWNGHYEQTRKVLKDFLSDTGIADEEWLERQ